MARGPHASRALPAGDRSRPGGPWRRRRPRAARSPATSRPDAERGAEVAQQRDRGEVRELAGARVLRRDVLDLHAETAELALDRHAMDVAGQAGHRVDLDARALRADAGQR